jgi:hypothetical protein
MSTHRWNWIFEGQATEGLPQFGLTPQEGQSQQIDSINPHLVSFVLCPSVFMQELTSEEKLALYNLYRKAFLQAQAKVHRDQVQFKALLEEAGLCEESDSLSDW